MKEHCKKINIYTVVMLILYGISLIACFICDLALNGTLTWFYMVLVSIGISFSVTNLPFMVPKHKIIVSALAVTSLTYLLLFVCCVYVKGDWLLSFAYPIATYSFVVAWVLLFVFKSKKLNWGFKIALALFISGIFVLTCNLLLFALTKEEFSLVDLFQYNGGVANYSANGIVFICLIVGSIISAVIGLILLKLKQPNHSEN